jgi:hypothetical protein
MALVTPTPSRSCSNNQVYGSPTVLGLTTEDILELTPADSGYGSSFATPKRPVSTPVRAPISKYNQFPLWDGHGSSNNPSPSSEGCSPAYDSDGDVFSASPDRAQAGDGPPKKRLRSATLPQTPTVARPSLPASFYSEGSLRATKSGSGVRVRRLKQYSLRTPDRFVPLRDSIVPVADVYRVSKPVQKLSAAERLRRNQPGASDPFVFRRQLVSPMASARLTRSDTRAVHNGGTCCEMLVCVVVVLVCCTNNS